MLFVLKVKCHHIRSRLQVMRAIYSNICVTAFRFQGLISLNYHGKEFFSVFILLGINEFVRDYVA